MNLITFQKLNLYFKVKLKVSNKHLKLIIQDMEIIIMDFKQFILIIFVIIYLINLVNKLYYI